MGQDQKGSPSNHKLSLIFPYSNQTALASVRYGIVRRNLFDAADQIMPLGEVLQGNIQQPLTADISDFSQNWRHVTVAAVASAVLIGECGHYLPAGSAFGSRRNDLFEVYDGFLIEDSLIGPQAGPHDALFVGVLEA